jgi:glyoxylase-like metal-dependent hydrolase (beta-lactamase superfamily II)
MVVIDPGPDVDPHVRALASAVAGADEVSILVTHDHSDHAAAAVALSRVTGADIVGPSGVDGVARTLDDGAVVETDDGDLVAVSTPGHAAEHYCFWWRERRALFAGDLMLGKGDTTWVAGYPGCVAEYLDSIARVRALTPAVIYPAHGPPIEDVPEALRRYEDHRRERIHQVREALSAHPDAGPDELLDVVYGPIPRAMRRPARESLDALLDFVRHAH